MKEQYRGFSISLADGWRDITDSLVRGSSPITLADAENGVGALQLSPALYKAGALPKICLADLNEMLDDFALKRELGEPHDRQAALHPMALVAASYRSGRDLMQVWYLSDGRNLMFATYVCDWDDRQKEIGICEQAVRSIEFT